MIRGTNVSEISYTYEDGNESSVTGGKLNYKGKKPQDGEVKVSKNGKVALAIHNGKYCVEKIYSVSEVTISQKSKDECKLISLPTGEVCGDSFVDPRDNETYKTVKIGNQCWFAENLRYTGNGCLNNPWNTSLPYNACRKHQASDGTYTYVDWDEEQVVYQIGAAMNGSTTMGAQGACPNGWHIPTDDEWKVLEGYVDSNYDVGNSLWDIDDWRGFDVGTTLKSSTYWEGTDKYGFNILPVGDRDHLGNLRNVGFDTTFWTSSLFGTNSTWVRYIRTGYLNTFRTLYYGYPGASVRCLLN